MSNQSWIPHLFNIVFGKSKKATGSYGRDLNLNPNAEISQHVSDVELSLVQVSKRNPMRIGGASQKGRGHTISGDPRQDSFSIYKTRDHVIIGLADGVSSSPNSHLGAQLVTHELINEYLRYINPATITSSESWFELNQSLSKKIVAKYIALKRENKESFPEEVPALRESAADQMATTLEILILEIEANEFGSRNFYHVRICGDGGLFHIKNGQTNQLECEDDSSNGAGKGKVYALPANDSQPVIRTGCLGRGEALLLCTDGVSDFLKSSHSWQAELTLLFEEKKFSYASLLRFISYNAPDAFDDKTAVFVSA